MLAAQGGPAPQPGVWAENADVVIAWLTVASQWRVSQGAWIGLDYAGVKTVLEAREIAAGPDLWAGLQVMEFAAREALNAQTRR